MTSGLEGRAVIVTGAARGVGLACAWRFARAGASVMMADLDEDKLAAEVETLCAQGFDGRAQGFAGDLREKLSMANLVAATLDAFDGVDVLVNASRLLVSADPLIPDGDRFEETLNQNVIANLRLSQLAARRMIEAAAAEGESRADRAIVNMSSIHSQRSLPELMGFSVSCAAIERITRALAIALAGHAIRVNAVAVGGFTGGALSEAVGDQIEDFQEALTEVIPLGRIADAQEIAEAALFLGSPAASFITGQVLAVDGGRLLLDPFDATGT